MTIANLRRGDKHTPHVSTCPPLVSFDGVQGMNECVTAFEGVNWKTDASSPEIMEFALRDRLLADDDVLVFTVKVISANSLTEVVVAMRAVISVDCC